MKRALLILTVAMALIAAVAVADTTQVFAQFLGGIYVGPRATSTTTNRATRMLAGSITFDFASASILCEDSTGITVTGAQTGDPCFVGIPTTLATTLLGRDASYTCYVSAADTVKVRHCPAGTADNPGSVVYRVRVISSQ